MNKAIHNGLFLVLYYFLLLNNNIRHTTQLFHNPLLITTLLQILVQRPDGLHPILAISISIDRFIDCSAVSVDSGC